MHKHLAGWGITLLTLAGILLPFSQAIALTPEQIQAIVTLVRSFGGDDATLRNVEDSLYGRTPTSSGSNSSVTPSSSARFCYDFRLNLSVGATGEDVRALNTILSTEGVSDRVASENTYFGEKTASHVVKLQQKFGISPASGYMGPLTREKLNQQYGCKKEIPREFVCAQDVFQCPDGTYVNRMAPSCRFAECTKTTPSQVSISSVMHGADKNGAVFDFTIYDPSKASSYFLSVSCPSGVTAFMKNTPACAGLTLWQGLEKFSIEYIYTSAVSQTTGVKLLAYNSARVQTGGDADAFALPANASSSSQPSITVLSPNGGEALQVGSVYAIKWLGKNVGKNIAINLSDQTAGSRYGTQYAVRDGTKVFGNDQRDGESEGFMYFNWTVPSTIPAGSNYKLYVGDATPNVASSGLTDESNALFSITSGGSSNSVRRDTITSYYRELLLREPDTAGLDYWDKGNASLDVIKAGIMASYEYGVKKQISALYQELLGRTADKEGMEYWYTKMYVYQWTLSQVRDGIMASEEYRNKKGGGTILSCKDSDGGRNPDFAGLTDGRVNGIGSYFNDVSVTSSGGVCSGDSCTAVAEGYCTSDGKVTNILTQCSTGYSVNGACAVKPAQPVTEVWSSDGVYVSSIGTFQYLSWAQSRTNSSVFLGRTVNHPVSAPSVQVGYTIPGESVVNYYASNFRFGSADSASAFLSSYIADANATAYGTAYLVSDSNFLGIIWRTGSNILFLHANLNSPKGRIFLDEAYSVYAKRFVPEVTVAAQPTITLLSPNGGESYRIGDTVTVAWNTQNAGAVPFTRLYLSSKTTGMIPQYTKTIGQSGSVMFVLGTDLSAGDYQIDVCLESNLGSSVKCDSSNSYFSVTATTSSTVTPTPVSLSLALNTTTEDRAGVWGTFKAGVGNANKSSDDWNWTATLSVPSSKTIKSVKMDHNVVNEHWSTDNASDYPLVVVEDGAQLNYASGQTIIAEGNQTFRLFGQKESTTSYGFRVTVTFTDGTSVSANAQ